MGAPGSNVLSGHAMQACWPSTLLKVPISQFLQATASSDCSSKLLNLPTTQLVQADCPSKLLEFTDNTVGAG